MESKSHKHCNKPEDWCRPQDIDKTGACYFPPCTTRKAHAQRHGQAINRAQDAAGLEVVRDVFFQFRTHFLPVK